METIQAYYRWEGIPELLCIDQDAVHLWRLYIPAAAPYLEKLTECLTLTERERAERYKVAARRDMFVVGRSVLRILLGRYTNTPPSKVSIYYAPLGKPYLDKTKNGLGLTFNLSHSGEWLVYAFGRSRMLGVDIEFHRKAVQPAEIAERFFSPDELKYLLGFEGAMRRRIFYQMWVAKEACLKARGTGLARSLRDLELPFVEDTPALFHTLHCDKNGNEWCLYPFTVADDYSCALVSSPPPGAVRHLHWALSGCGL